MAKKKKVPYRRYTDKEIKSIENDSYVIQVGIDLYSEDGRFVFTKQAAVVTYNKILKELLDVLDGGDDEERTGAQRCLANFHVMPLRIN